MRCIGKRWQIWGGGNHILFRFGKRAYYVFRRKKDLSIKNGVMVIVDPFCPLALKRKKLEFIFA